MIIRYKKKKLYIGQFKLKCCIGKAGIKKKKLEGDKSTPSGTFKLGDLYLRKDRVIIGKTKLKKIFIKKNMGWCNDTKSPKYNKLIKIHKKVDFSYEKMLRRDYKYDLLIPIFYNYYRPIKNSGSAIFIHLTKNYSPTVGCIGLTEKDFKILIKVMEKNSKIVISN